MIAEQIVTIVVAILGSSLIQYLISRHDARKDKFKAIEEKQSETDARLDDIDLGNTRMQMLLLMALYPDDKHELMQVAEKYFWVLHGDLYMTSIFQKWLIKNGEEIPEWFEREELK